MTISELEKEIEELQEKIEEMEKAQNEQHTGRRAFWIGEVLPVFVFLLIVACALMLSGLRW